MNKNKILGYALGSFGTGLLSAISLPLIAWFYPIEDIGRISMFQVFISFSILLFCLGLDQSYVREYYETDNKALLFKTAIIPGLMLCLLIFSIIIIYDINLISNFLYNTSSTYLSILTITSSIAVLISRFFSLSLRMEERAIAFSMSQLLPKAFFLICILITVWSNLTRNIYTLVTANTLAIVLAFCIFSWNTRSVWTPALTQTINRNHINQLLAFGLPLVIGGVASWGLNVMDKIFLRSMSTYTELGLYSVTISISSVAMMFTGIFNTIWSPMIYKWVTQENLDYQKIDNIMEHVLAAIYFVVVLAGMFSWIIPYLLPKEYNTIQYLLAACLLAPLFYTLSETTAVGITLARKTNLAMLASIGAMLINLVGNYILVPRYGASGATASTAFSFWVFYILRTEFSRVVWRKMPVMKAHLATLILIVLSIINIFFTHMQVYLILIWLSALIIGLYVFSYSSKIFFFKLKELYTKNYTHI